MKNRIRRGLLLFHLQILCCLSSPWALSITSISPSNGDLSVPIGASISVIFDSPLNPSSINSDTVILMATGGQGPVPGTFSVSQNGFSFMAGSDLRPGITYTLTMTNGIKDSSGNPLAPLSIQFTTGFVSWPAGAYTLLINDEQIDANSAFLSNNYVTGIAANTLWNTGEPQPGQYNFTNLDNTLSVAKAHQKTVSVAFSAFVYSNNNPRYASNKFPSWVDPQRVYYAPYGPSKTCQRYPVPGDPNYLTAWTGFVEAAGKHYHQERPDLLRAIGYVRGASEAMTVGWNLPTKIYSDPDCATPTTWNALGYTQDRLVSAIKQSLDAFRNAFPEKPILFEVGNVKFDSQPLAVAEKAAAYGFGSAPDRFMVWREDLNANVSKEEPPSSNFFWTIMSEDRPRDGAQMVWTVQDCPGTCRIAGRTGDHNMSKQQALQTAMEIGASNVAPHGYYLMSYQEIYRVDVEDQDLSPVFSSEAKQFKPDMTPPIVPGSPSAQVNGSQVTFSWGTSTGSPGKSNSYTNSLIPPPALPASFGSVGYHVFRDGVPIARTTGQSLADSSASPGSHVYTVSAFDASGNESAQSPAVTVTVGGVAPAITAQPSDVTIDAGQTATFSITATGNPATSYKWQRKKPILKPEHNWSAVTGATSDSYTTPTDFIQDSGDQFRCIVSNSLGQAISNPATLTVVPRGGRGTSSIVSPIPPFALDSVNIYPNPFRPAQGHTQITFANLPASSKVSLFALNGEKINELIADGTGIAAWDGNSSSGVRVASGVYFAVFEGNGQKRTMKVAIQR